MRAWSPVFYTVLIQLAFRYEDMAIRRRHFVPGPNTFFSATPKLYIFCLFELYACTNIRDSRSGSVSCAGENVNDDDIFYQAGNHK